MSTLFYKQALIDLKILQVESLFNAEHGPDIRRLCLAIAQQLQAFGGNFTTAVVVHSLVAWREHGGDFPRIHKDLREELERLTCRTSLKPAANTNHPTQEAA